MDSEDVKSIITSKTVWGGIVSAGAAAYALATHQTVTPNEQAVLTDQLTHIAGGLFTVIGLVMVIWGRFTATKKITITGKPPVTASQAPAQPAAPVTPAQKP